MGKSVPSTGATIVGLTMQYVSTITVFPEYFPTCRYEELFWNSWAIMLPFLTFPPQLWFHTSYKHFITTWQIQKSSGLRDKCGRSQALEASNMWFLQSEKKKGIAPVSMHVTTRMLPFSSKQAASLRSVMKKSYVYCTSSFKNNFLPWYTLTILYLLKWIQVPIFKLFLWLFL